MKFLTHLTSVFLLLGGLATAAPQTYQMEVQVVRVPASTQSPPHLVGRSEWREQIKSGRYQVLESSCHENVAGMESRSHTGAKIPWSYTDPRAAGSQVQYFDAGLKVDGKPSERPGGGILLECRLERSALTRGNLADGTDVVVANSTLLLQPGQVAVVWSTRGQLTAGYLKSIYPGVVFTPEDTILITVCLLPSER